MPNIKKDNREQVKGVLERLTPTLKTLAGVDPRRVSTVVLSEFAKNPSLYYCSHASLSRCIIEASKLNLEFGDHLGQAYLIPFKERGGDTNVTLIIGYRGLRELVYRSGKVRNIYAETVHEGDEFAVELGIGRTITHQPDFAHDRTFDNLIAVYAVAEFHDGSTHFEVMTKSEVNTVRASARSGSGPWQTHPLEMVRKTAVRRICKQLPQSVIDQSVNHAIHIDERAEYATGNQFDMDIEGVPVGTSKVDEVLGSAVPDEPEAE